MSGRIVVEAPGPRATLERAAPGRAHLGVSAGGPCDARAALVANRLAGNRDDAAVLELVVAGPRLRFEADARVAVAGAPLAVHVDGAAVHQRVLDVRAGQRVALGAVARGLRTCVAVRGGLTGPPGPLGAGAVLHVGDALAPRARQAPAYSLDVLQDLDVVVLRAVAGPDAALLDAAARAALSSSTWTVSPASDRRGVRLEGAPLPRPARELVTVGVCAGSVQLPPSGTPVILGVDGATTGGYPVVAVVARVDLWLLGQLRPGARVRLAAVSLAEARDAWRARVDQERGAGSPAPGPLGPGRTA